MDNQRKKESLLKQGKKWMAMLLVASLLIGVTAASPEVSAMAAERDRVEAFVERLYTILLGRNVEKEGLKYWTDVLVSGEDTGANVAANIVFSEELNNRNLSNEEFVTRMYQTVFDREPDTEGENYWLGVLADGETRAGAGRNLLNSEEFGDICTQYGITQGVAVVPEDAGTGSGTTTELVRDFVKRLYSILLGREVDAEGLEYWTDVLVTGRDTGARVAAGIVFSKELEERNLPDDRFVGCMYKTVFDRIPDPEGAVYWLNRLLQGTHRNTVGKEMLNSPEFGDICKQYKITQGEVDWAPLPTPTPTPVIESKPEGWIPPAYSDLPPVEDYEPAPGVTIDGNGKTQWQCGDTATMTLYTDGTLVVSGTGRMWDSPIYAPFGDCQWREAMLVRGEDVKKIVVEEGITYIGKHAFRGCNFMEYIDIASSVKEIGTSAFIVSSNVEDKVMKELRLREGLEIIGPGAFYNCLSPYVSELILPSTLTNIGKSAFNFYFKNYEEYGLKAVTVPAGVISLGKSAFMGWLSWTGENYVKIYMEGKDGPEDFVSLEDIFSLEDKLYTFPSSFDKTSTVTYLGK